MKKLIKYLFPAVLLCFITSGCSNLLTKLTGTDNESTAEGTVAVTIGAEGLSEDSGSGRTILPDAESSIAQYVLYGSTDSSDQDKLATFSTLDDDAVVNLTSGTWYFTLEAENSDGSTILSGTENSISIAADPVTLTFTLSPLSTGTGSISITISWPDSVGVSSIIPTFAGTVGSELTITDDDGDSSSAVYSKSAVTAGGYLISFSLQDSNDKEIASIPDYVQVYGNLESTASFELTEDDFNSVPDAPSGLAVTVADGDNDDTAAVTLKWEDNSTNEKAFEAAYSTDDGTNWTTTSLDAASITTTFSGLTRGISYTFRILAQNDFGDSDSDTATQSVPFKAPASLSPADGSATAETDPALSWDAVTNADHYEVQLATSEDGVADADAESTDSGTVTLTPSSYPDYYSYWRVRAVDSDGENGEWSAVQAITVGWESLSVTISSPGTVTTGSTDPSTTTDDTPEFTWDAVNGAEKYELYIATSEDDITSATAIELTTNSYTPDVEDDVLDNNTTYYWRVAAVTTDALNSDAETTTAYSTMLHFKVLWNSDGADGDGPADNIRYIKELEYIADNTSYLDGYYKLGADIDLSSVTSWTPIGDDDNPFTGTFDGNSYTITGLTISSGSSDYQGLFGYTSGATLTDIVLTEVSITGGSYDNIGALAGYCKNGSATGCTSAGTISGDSYMGGLIGVYRSYSTVTISSCSSSCTVTGTGEQIGGLIGLVYDGTADTILTVSDCSATGTVEGEYTTGGLIGKLYDYSIVTDCYATGDVTGTGSYSNSEYGTGGLIGCTYGIRGVEPTCSVKNSYATGAVEAEYNVGGLVGSNGSQYSTSSNYSYAGKITCCYATGSVTGTSSCTGGLVGYNTGYSTIDNSFATGSVTGTDDVGGCIGYNYSNTTVSYCYSIGKVTSTEDSPSYIGGFIGRKSGTVTSCFYDRTTSGQSDDSGKGSPEYTSAMKTESTFTSASDGGWDFVDEDTNGTDYIWNITSGLNAVNDGYPYLNDLPPED